MTAVRRNRLAAAVVLHQGRVLLVRRSYRERFLPGVWGVPSGKLEPGERPEDAVLRELKEETGLSGEIIGTGGERTFFSRWNGATVENTQRNFLVRPLSLEVALPEPDQEYRWVPVAELDGFGLDDHNLGTIRQSLPHGRSAPRR
ncbi:NUDIX hydrolase [Streptomyces sp. YIM 98790]|uniref:NUDIX hydrolase n=1 Tax=Streptomyces sp. YIM 98790 TaxID=2689077 RepID=UPI0028BD8E36|nr:NUDIX hydrolase [Streptomyces sp. YIM 98790]